MTVPVGKQRYGNASERSSATQIVMPLLRSYWILVSTYFVNSYTCRNFRYVYAGLLFRVTAFTIYGVRWLAEQMNFIIFCHISSITTHLSWLFTRHVSKSRMPFSGVSSFCYQINISWRLPSVIVYAFDYLRCPEIVVENILIDKCIIHYECSYTYFKLYMFKIFFL
jgi:hypothetical protein